MLFTIREQQHGTVKSHNDKYFSNAVTRVLNYIEPNQRRLIMKTFITPQFGYCPILCMFHTRRIKNRINRMHERLQTNVADTIQK